MASKKTTVATIEKTYIMDLSGGRLRRITVPASWKVTFGPLVPRREDDRHQHKTFALRFYEGKDQQRAIFTDVLSFRDESLKVEERITKTKQQVVKKEAPGGAREMVVEARITEWRDPLAPQDGAADNAFLAISDKNADL